MAKRSKKKAKIQTVKFADVPEGGRFSFPKTGERGRRAIFTKTSGRSYQSRTGEKLPQRAQAIQVDMYS